MTSTDAHTSDPVPSDDSWLPVEGVRLAAGAAGIRYQGRDDLLVLELVGGSRCAAVFTRNAFCAAPVRLAKTHLGRTAPRYLLINAGNANAGTGRRGLADAESSCAALAAIGECSAQEVLPFSTGVIGEHLPVDRIAAALPELLGRLDAAAWPAAARAIMTTDRVPKLVSRRFEIDGHTASITGIAKGAGMICPNMATMLAFIATDAAVAPDVLQACLGSAVARSFNAITVDGDTSTNDACVLVATGVCGNAEIRNGASPQLDVLQTAVDAVCLELATAIVRDAEGATKLVTVEVEGAADVEEARAVAYTIAHSPLVKTALFASDPNWGRILAAVGRAGLRDLDIDRIRIHLGEVLIVDAGGRAPDYTEEAGAAVMAEPEILIRVSLGRGPGQAQILTCDLSYDYVRINAEYRS
ncbi:bifunctional glutamate N-acetyltransferase/amino-acid acetyltransferase ArgJ [Thiocapsa marina]|uniref:Arginine biosynthesis bifunctional protein ArgJ n=1 Tax=Thiocapsa marina 5811 TaxID=768671 RepID=F9U8H5_9GAMM|nr:bifunctional glutamate N-acetyltransferase/amino-acid acetyltransferase ArgJ [Thiocapsa marina]EGV19587.1 Arginine biosynthesis bifunctional protein ArgJ [Thiocapsa marina 5811]